MLNKIKRAVFFALALTALSLSLCSCRGNARQEGLVSNFRDGVERAGEGIKDGISRANDFFE